MHKLIGVCEECGVEHGDGEFDKIIECYESIGVIMFDECFDAWCEDKQDE